MAENNDLLQDFVGDTYEIIAKFYPAEGTRKVGFKVRTGEGEQTLVVYDLENQRLSLDRSHSGIIISGKFAEAESQYVEMNADGSVDLHIYVDKSSVEVFAMGYTASGAEQIFPSPLSVGAEVLLEGDAAKADITIYPLDSIWTEKIQVTEPQYIGSTQAVNQKLYVGDTLKLTAYVLPTTASQEFTWTVKDGSNVAEVDASGTVTALQKGTAVVVAASVANPALTREFTIHVTENNFKTNIPAFVNVSGNWHIDDETLSVSNGGQNDYYMSAEAIQGDFTLETDIRYTGGLINLFLVSEGLNPHEDPGAYTIQFGHDTNVRLFPFGHDDFARGTLEAPINDGEYHHVKVIKKEQTIEVYVDDVKCLEHTFEQTEGFYANGHVGIGLWDGALEVQNFFVNPVETASVASNETTGAVYATPAEALKEAQEGDIVKLLDDTAEDHVLVYPGITLDLNGHGLSAGYAVGFIGADIIDNAGGGRLNAAQRNVVLDENNAMIPGYVFTKAGFAIRWDTAHEDEGIKINAVACPVNMEVVELLKNGCADNNIQIMIRLTWDTGDAIGSQEFVFDDEVVAQVYSSNDGSWAGYGRM